MKLSVRCFNITVLLGVILLAFPACAGEAPLFILGGEIGAAADTNLARFRSPPFDSLPWLRADLTGEKVSEFDNSNRSIMFRPFKNYSGDISGRFIEIMALNCRGSRDIHPAFAQLLAEVPSLQRAGGYFAASGIIDWQLPVRSKGGPSMPVLWGNARMLCGLVEASRAFSGDTNLLAAARKLGNFYIGIVPRFTDPSRLEEYTNSGSYASGYVTCWFPAMEGLVKLSALTGEKKYLEAAITMATFYQRFDRIPIEHSHGMLCNQVSLLLLFEATRNSSYLARVEKRWDELVRRGYINPAGGILERCKVEHSVDEGCALADWLRLNLELGRLTGKARYWDMAERTLHNHFLQNETSTGGFGHRGVLCDQDGTYGFKSNIREATWCCDYHGQIGFLNLRTHLLERGSAGLTCNMALDFSNKDSVGTVTSTVHFGTASGEVMRQRIRLEGMPNTVVRVRQPYWADAVTAVGTDGSALPLGTKDGFCVTCSPVLSVEFIFVGGVYAEDRHFHRLSKGPVTGQSIVLGYGPKLLAADSSITVRPAWLGGIDALKAQGFEPFAFARPSASRNFVFNCSIDSKSN